MSAAWPPDRWVFPLPRAQFEREWTLGRATFRPAGELAAEIVQRRAEVGDAEGHLLRWQIAHDVATAFASATIDVQADTSENARSTLAESMAVLRFFLRDLVGFNVDVHRIGLPGEVNLAVLNYVLLAANGVAAAGWSLEDAPINFTFVASHLAGWDEDPVIGWLSAELARAPEERSEAGRRAIIAFSVCDQAFMARDSMARVLLSDLSVETMFASGKEYEQRKSTTLQIARRLAYLTCDQHGGEAPLCPYLAGLDRNKDAKRLAEEWSRERGYWQCSPFLDIATPPELERHLSRTSLFAARNEAAHEGRTSADKKEIGRLRYLADRSLLAGCRWFANHQGLTIGDLDQEIDEVVERKVCLDPSGRPS